ncbi:MAG: MqnA/MqnD/SBP family protein [Verrucomicrobiota bacterium]
MPKVTLAHSPDPDDAFMFYALAENKIDTGDWEFEHELQDIQTLNERAFKGELDITAVSIHAYCHLTDQYILTPCGASMGDGYGPILIGKKKFSKDELKSIRIAVPGKLTSAYLQLQLYLEARDEELNTVVVPFDEIFQAVNEGKADAGLVIHEGQITWEEEGFTLSEDLGIWWKEETGGLPLPLGGNVIKKSFSQEAQEEITRILRESIRYGLEHREAGVIHSMPLGRGLNQAKTDRFVGMYVNELTLDYGERGRNGIREFLKRSYEAGLLSSPVTPEFVEA